MSIQLINKCLILIFFGVLFLTPSHCSSTPSLPSDPSALDDLSFFVAHLRGGWFSYLRALNNSDTISIASPELCLSPSFNTTLHQLVSALVDFRSQYFLRISNYTIVLVAGIGECGF